MDSPDPGLLAGILASLALSIIDWYPIGLVAGFFLGGAIVIAGTGTQTLMQNAWMELIGGDESLRMIFRGGPALVPS